MNWVRLSTCLFFFLHISCGTVSAEEPIYDPRPETHFPTNYSETHDFSLLFGSLKNANLGFQYQYNHRVKHWLTAQAMIGFNAFEYRIFSASDEHRIQSLWIPVSAGSRINMINRPKFSGYMMGKFGWAFGVNGDNHSLKSDITYEYGIGALTSVFKKPNVLLKTEVGRQQYTFQGQATGSFQSVIDYNLTFTSYFLRVGMAYVIQ